PYNSFSFAVNVTATHEIYTLSLHDALPIYTRMRGPSKVDERGVIRQQHRAGDGVGARTVGKPHSLTAPRPERVVDGPGLYPEVLDRKSTRLNSSHVKISYAVFCLKKKT